MLSFKNNQTYISITYYSILKEFVELSQQHTHQKHFLNLLLNNIETVDSLSQYFCVTNYLHLNPKL